MYKLKRRTFNIDDLIPYLLLLTPVITVLFVALLWSLTGAGGR